ncbi:SDR family NAD(P)-dependent oxidoreductase [Novosphingobium bradum]|uniref:SDR family NAD(P)-dependent oxidoreductase n=1 Tax=Novosphingobium bradum TaxID=1737444 RepID=A0ABV7IJP0_9SPHN
MSGQRLDGQRQDGQRLDGRVALITGGGGAIGAATAIRLARAGARLAIADIRREPAEQVVATLRGEGFDAEAFVVNLAHEAEILAMVEAVMARFGQIDILHNNAALGGKPFAADKTLLEMTAEVWDLTFAVNVRAPMLLAKAVLPQMIARGGGAIVNTSSGVTDITSTEAFTAYAPSKGALQILTRYIAAQGGPHNIRCNAVLPGVVLTEGMQAMFGDDQLKVMSDRFMLKRVCLPEDIAAMVHFLASDDARQVTGELIRVTGGR